MRHYFQRKVLWIVFLTLLTTLVLVHSFHSKSDLKTHIDYYSYPNKSIYCYRLKQDEKLPDISNIEVRKGKSIFFHETTCRSHRNGKIVILPRQACAVESAARLNPNYDVYVMFLSPGVFKFEGTESDRIIQKLLEYKNIKILHLNYENYTRNTPLEQFYKNDTLKESSFPHIHASDMLRYLTLYKYGGIYLDMDVVVIKSLEDLKPNYAGVESDRIVAAGVLSFDHKGVGHKHAESCVLDLKNNFKKSSWSHNGPGVIKRLLRKLCGVKLSKDMVNKNCANFTVYPKHMFYPINWEAWKKYFDSAKALDVYKKVKDSHVLHVWNRLSEGTKIPIGTKTAYTLFAEEFCPKTYNECDRYF